MFEQLSDRLNLTLKKLKGQARITEENIATPLREIRMALLEADVALPVVRELINSIKAKAVGEEVRKSLTPGQVLVRVVNNELTRLMGEKNIDLDLSTQPPAVVLLAGLQGAGKTTTAAKLAKFLKDRKQKKVLLVSADVYRPAAIDQLKKLAFDLKIDFHPSSADDKAVDIAESALNEAKNHLYDVLIIDTAGRLHVDSDLMDEIQAVHKTVNPIETLFVVDSMTGQDAVNSAKAFDEALPLSGVVLTKMDGDARGGTALSIRQITGKPIKFIGVGEGLDALEAFHPDRISSRILGMGDVVSLVEDVEHKVDQEKAQKMARKLKKGRVFTLEDFRDQIQQMENMGGLGSMLEKLPGANAAQAQMLQQQGGKQFGQITAIINSMTPLERQKPAVINGSRKRRIAKGSGTQIQDVNRLLKQFNQMQKMMKKMKNKGAMKRMMQGLGGRMGMPGGMPFN